MVANYYDCTKCDIATSCSEETTHIYNTSCYKLNLKHVWSASLNSCQECTPSTFSNFSPRFTVIDDTDDIAMLSESYQKPGWL